MKTVVLDSSVVLKWFRTENEPNLSEALAVRRAWENTEFDVIVPPVFILEMINVPARKWGVSRQDLRLIAEEVAALAFDVAQTDPHAVAERASDGLSAYDASYVAAAAERGIPLITADQRLISLASDVAVPLAAYSSR